MSTALIHPTNLSPAAPVASAGPNRERGRRAAFACAGLTPRQLGQAGEDYAAQWLARRGWRILERNFCCRYGEIDMVALDPSRDIAFVEVKTRRSNAQGLPQEAVDARKRANLRKAAMEWLLDESRYVAHRGTRFDVIAIRVSAGEPTIAHIPEAF